MYSCNGKTELSASLLQSSVSHDSSEIILNADLVAKKHLLSVLKQVVLLNILMESFFRNSLMVRKNSIFRYLLSNCLCFHSHFSSN